MEGETNIGFQFEESTSKDDINKPNRFSGLPQQLNIDIRQSNGKSDINESESTTQNSSQKLENVDENRSNALSSLLVSTRDGISEFVEKKKPFLNILATIILHGLLITYFIFATLYYNKKDYEMDWCSGYGLLIIIYAFTYFLIFYYKIVKTFFAACLNKFLIKPLKSVCRVIFKLRYATGIFWLAFFAACLIFLVFDSKGNTGRLIPLIGISIFLGFGFVFSKYPGQIKWHTVFMGLALQFVFGIITIRWPPGRNALRCFGDKVAGYLSMTIEGASMVFGNTLVIGTPTFPPVFAFSVLPVIYFVSFCISILYYYGIMQSVVLKMGWALGSVMNTTICESVNSAANIFLGMTESLILLRPYMDTLTKSELHSIMASGFATVSGSVLAAYISFGADPAHLITASVMSAPAALCFSKLFFPEIEESMTTADNMKLEDSTDSSVLDAASKGASSGTEIVLGIISNLIGFISFVALLNTIVRWLGVLVGYMDITFEWIVGQIFIPLSWTMGVPWEECESVGTLIGLKTMINEFAAYERLGQYIESGLLSPRGKAIATYALCGFSNPGSIGIMIGALASMIPNKRKIVTGIVVRAFLSGTIVCFMTACVAATLIDETSEIENV